MEMESGRQKTSKPSVLEKTQQALEKATKPQSGLASRLLHLWATGVLSAIMVRELAQLALSDGADHAELIKLAECANWGCNPGNTHRQILGKFCSDVMIAEPFCTKVKCIDPKTSLEKEEQVSFFLPPSICTPGRTLPHVLPGSF